MGVEFAVSLGERGTGVGTKETWDMLGSERDESVEETNEVGVSCCEGSRDHSSWNSAKPRLWQCRFITYICMYTSTW
jgi:hypothetical protein